MSIIPKMVGKFINKMQPAQIMVMGFAAVILIGGLLLDLPIATRTGESIGLVKALFTSTSAVCVTGLVVVDTSTYWSLFGQIVIIALIQVGGLGFMTVSTLFALLMKKRINLRERLLIQESLNQHDLSGIVRLVRYTLLLTLTIEGIGALILSTTFIPQFGIEKGIWYSVFHSISAFCNAGFDLMGSTTGAFTSFASYVNNFTITMTISSLIVLGGLGYPVILDILRNRKISKLMLHSKIAIVSTIMLILIGTVFIFGIEYNNPDTLGNLPLGGKILASLFQSVTTRTAGYFTVDFAKMHQTSILVSIILMFIGASPASTGGGIKTTTFATLILTVRSFILGKEDIEVYGRRVGTSTVRKSVGIVFVAISSVIAGTFIISLTNPAFSLVDSCFEVTSALATVGLSLAGSQNLNTFGKIIIMIYMFMGRVGSLTIFMALLSKGTNKKQPIKYPEGRIIVG